MLPIERSAFEGRGRRKNVMRMPWPYPVALEEPSGALELVAVFDGAMPTGVTVSHQGRIFVNFPRWATMFLGLSPNGYLIRKRPRLSRTTRLIRSPADYLAVFVRLGMGSGW
jgi:hypothetical protein